MKLEFQSEELQSCQESQLEENTHPDNHPRDSRKRRRRQSSEGETTPDDKHRHKASVVCEGGQQQHVETQYESPVWYDNSIHSSIQRPNDPKVNQSTHRDVYGSNIYHHLHSDGRETVASGPVTGLPTNVQYMTLPPDCIPRSTTYVIPSSALFPAASGHDDTVKKLAERIERLERGWKDVQAEVGDIKAVLNTLSRGVETLVKRGEEREKIQREELAARSTIVLDSAEETVGQPYSNSRRPPSAAISSVPPVTTVTSAAVSLTPVSSPVSCRKVPPKKEAIVSRRSIGGGRNVYVEQDSDGKTRTVYALDSTSTDFMEIDEGSSQQQIKENRSIPVSVSSRRRSDVTEQIESDVESFHSIRFDRNGKAYDCPRRTPIAEVAQMDDLKWSEKVKKAAKKRQDVHVDSRNIPRTCVDDQTDPTRERRVTILSIPDEQLVQDRSHQDRTNRGKADRPMSGLVEIYIEAQYGKIGAKRREIIKETGILPEQLVEIGYAYQDPRSGILMILIHEHGASDLVRQLKRAGYVARFNDGNNSIEDVESRKERLIEIRRDAKELDARRWAREQLDIILG